MEMQKKLPIDIKMEKLKKAEQAFLAKEKRVKEAEQKRKEKKQNIKKQFWEWNKNTVEPMMEEMFRSASKAGFKTYIDYPNEDTVSYVVKPTIAATEILFTFQLDDNYKAVKIYADFKVMHSSKKIISRKTTVKDKQPLSHAEILKAFDAFARRIATAKVL
jgi:hypothetical protein